jgi:adenine-specific DNA-methyltransferase
MELLLKEDLIFWEKKNGGWIPYEKIYYAEGETKKIKERSILYELATTGDGANELTQIFGVKDIFENPKPTELLKFFIQHSTNEDSIILDFFAGSGTTAHAVLSLNDEEETKRRFILVQLPEAVSEKSVAYSRGLKNISDIAKTRIKKVLKGYGTEAQPINDGFKVFKLTESNYPENLFEFDPEKSEDENKKAFADYLSKAKQPKLFDDTKAVEIVYENVVKEGLSLNSKVAEEKIGKNNVYSVTDGERQLLICLDKKIDDKTVNELTSKDFKDKTFICLDNALDDTAKANLGLNVELKTI